MDWTPVIDWLKGHGIQILIIIVISLALYFTMRRVVPIFVERTVKRTMKGRPKSAKKKRTDTLSAVFIQTGIVVISIIALFSILSEIDVPVAPALAGLGIAGVAIGFGAQNLVKDILNGLFILLENHYGVGDYVQLAGVDGIVEEVGLRRTVLRNRDGTVHNIPNGEIKISSNSTKEWSRVDMNISVGYGENLDHVIDVINRVGTELAEDPDWAPVIIETPQVLRVAAFEDSGIAITILGKTKQMQQWNVMGELRLRLKKVFDEEEIEIPWPHTKVFFGNSPGNVNSEKAIEQKSLPKHLPSKRKQPKTIIPDDFDGDGDAR